MDLRVPSSTIQRARTGLRQPTASRGSRYTRAKHVLPLVRRPTELPRREIRSGRVRCRTSVLVSRSSSGDRSGAQRELRECEKTGLGYDGRL